MDSNIWIGRVHNSGIQLCNGANVRFCNFIPSTGIDDWFDAARVS